MKDHHCCRVLVRLDLRKGKLNIVRSIYVTYYRVLIAP